MNTKRQALGQLILCKGCCCGRTDRGLPEVPLERIEAAWREGRLNRTIQLTVSGCLGPCDVPNVVLLLTATQAVWLGGLAGDAAYETLVQWARDCDAAGAVVPIPHTLASHRLRRFPPEEGIA